MTQKIHYQVNICGGDFQHVRDSFLQWKEQPLIYRHGQSMFEGKEEVRPLTDRTFDNGERAHNALEHTCSPGDRYALAAEIHDGHRDHWLVMAAFEEER